MSAEKESSKGEVMKDDGSIKDEDQTESHDVNSEDTKEKQESSKKRGAKLKDVKKKETSDEEDDDEDMDGENEKSEDEKVPLLDQPLEISGARERKKVERFTEEFNEPKETKVIEIPQGRGTPLGEIPRTEAFLKKFKAESLKPLHRVLYNRVGKVTLVKNNIRKFSGFDFDKDSDQYEKKKHVLNKMEASVLRTICCILDIGNKGKREELAERIMTFLLEPKSSGKPVEDSRPRRSTAQKANNKGYSESDDEAEKRPSRAKRGKVQRKNLKEESSEGEENDDDDDEKKEKTKSKDMSASKNEDSGKEDEEEDDEPDDEGSSDDSESKSKTKRGNRGKQGTKKAVKKTNSKKTPNKKAEKKSVAKKRKTSSKSEDESSSEDEPLSKKTKAPPTDEEIKTYVKEILEGANLEEITMKTVCKQVYAHYPEFDLAHKKDFIKTTVKSLIST